MAYAVSDLIQRVREILQDQPFEDTITVDYTADATTIGVTDGAEWGEGDVIEFYDTGDRYLVQSVSGDNVTVLPNWDGTTSQGHSAGARIVKNPTFPYIYILDKTKAVIRALWPYVWKANSISVTPTPTTTVWYNLEPEAIDLVAVNQPVGMYVSFYGVEGGLPVLMRQNLPTDIVASGKGILFPGGYYSTEDAINVVVREKVTATVTSSSFDDLEEGIGPDCIAHGAAERLVADREVQRVTGSDVSLGDATVEPMRKLQTAAYFHAKFLELRNQWNAELEATIPPMKVWR